MEAQPVGQWLDELASKASTPGGGAGAAMNAAVGAALVSMVCNLTIGKPKYAEHEATMTEALAKAEDLRARALGLAADDAAAFDAVVAAYKLPKATDEEKQARTAAIQAALVGAAEVPLRTAALAAEVIDVAASILEGANTNVISDIAVAASSAKSALESGVVNVEVNLASMADEQLRKETEARLAEFTPAAGRADALVAQVRERLAR
ncbi:cyclodeaminase/cyclohydrolase family protein [Amycolatopsis japonica]|uniref:cyclodeaminase/cyclohydrolase family protein n=1 Tax=Amycolatopsis japonica TaxID=208439 RepID=UPI00380C10FE